MTEQPWSEVVTLSQASRGPLTRTLKADERARGALARLLDVNRIDSLDAEVTVSPWLDGAVLDGRWSAVVEQTCGVSLDPFTTDLAGRFSVRVVPAGSPNASVQDAQEIDIDPEGEDPPDVLETDRIDLAAYVVEHLALEIDPFPRKPGVEFEAPPEEKPASPFAVLQGLKDRGA